MQGENYEADILLVASNSKGAPKITVGESEIDVQDGVGKYVASASGVGIKTFSGMIVVEGGGEDGKNQFPFHC